MGGGASKIMSFLHNKFSPKDDGGDMMDIKDVFWVVAVCFVFCVKVYALRYFRFDGS